MPLGDLDDLIAECRTEEAREYIAEAVACYRAGAYRACTVVYDLLAKIRELALSGDGEAQAITGAIAALQPQVANRNVTAIKRILEIEHGILETANEKFGFFDGHHLIELSRLRNDRQRCAHPTYQGSEQPYAPTAELARTHLVHAVRFVLALPPVQGRAATAHVIAQVTSAYFPTEVAAAKAQLRAVGLDRPKDVLVKDVFDQLVLGFFEGSGNTAALKAQRRVLSAIDAALEMFPGVTEPRLRHHLNRIIGRLHDSDKRLYLAFVRTIAVSWDLLDQVYRDQLAQIVLAAPDTRAYQLLPHALALPGLQDAA